MENHIPFLCADISRLFRKHFAEAARSIGGTGPQWRMLLVLEQHSGINQGALAERMDVEPITACRMVDRLEQAGLVERRRDPGDRRVWQLFLTEKAAPVVADLKGIGGKMLDQVTSVLNEDENATLVRLLTLLRDNLAVLDEHPVAQEASNG